MADTKKYFYMRLADDFFDRNEIIYLQSLKDGYKYTDILMKLYTRSIKGDGKLMFNDRVPYDIKTLSLATRHDEKIVKQALKEFEELGLIEVLDNGVIYMLNIQNYIGKSSSEADRQREYYNRIKWEKESCSSNISNKESCKKSYKDSNKESTPEIEKEKELDSHSKQKRENTLLLPLWKELLKAYPNRRYADNVKKRFLEITGSNENPIEHAEHIVKAALLYRKYTEDNKVYPGDIPTLVVWLKNDVGHWIDKLKSMDDE